MRTAKKRMTVGEKGDGGGQGAELCNERGGGRREELEREAGVFAFVGSLCAGSLIPPIAP